MNDNCLEKLCGIAAAAGIIGVGTTLAAPVAVGVAEAAIGGAGFAVAISSRHRADFRRVFAGIKRQVEREYRDWIKQAHRAASWYVVLNIENALAELDGVIDECVPTPEEVARVGVNTAQLARLMLDKAAGANPAVYGPETENPAAREILSTIVTRTFELVRSHPEYAAQLRSYIDEEELRRLADIKGDTEALLTGQAEMQRQLVELKEMFAPQIAATASEYRLPREAVDCLLMTAGLVGVEPAAVPGAFEELARRFAAMQEALQQQRNDDPEIAVLTRRASEALTIADLGTAERTLAAIRDRQRALSKRRRRAADEARADLLAGLEEEADTCSRQADASLLRFDPAAAARFSREGIALLAEAPQGTRLRYSLRMAGSLREFGDRAGRNDSLLASIDLYRLALRDSTRARVPLGWAMIQNHLGSALATLGQRESGTSRLEEAIEAFRAALGERTRQRVPLGWAMTQHNLGTALTRLGERESGTARLEEAVAACRATLEEWTRERVPLQWAATQNNLGNALRALGERERGTARLGEAVRAFCAALEERTRERMPLDWAATQNNLGNAFARLGERESGTERLEEAVKAYRLALKERTRQRAPLDWAMTQNNLGNALTMLGQRESGTARLEEAVNAYCAALEEWTRDRVPLDWATAQNNLGNALQTLGEREGGTVRLAEAVKAYHSALQERTRDRVPLDWATTQNNLGSALARLGEQESGTARLEAAVKAYRAALEERARELVPLDWAMTQHNLGTALTRLGERESGTARLEKAVEAYRAALEERARELVPLDWR